MCHGKRRLTRSYAAQTDTPYIVFSAAAAATAVAFATAHSGGVSAPLPDAARRTASRLRAVRTLMDSGLTAIGEALSAGAFRHLSREELGGLVAAVFQESAARTGVLAAVERM
jgi:hypothetical protein